MSLSVDAVIATKDRPESCRALVSQLLSRDFFNKVIIVDSSEKDNSVLFNEGRIEYLRSIEKNQPFQRYLGYLSSKADILYFFDDDVRIESFEGLIRLSRKFENKEVVGAGLKMNLTRDNPEKFTGTVRHNLLINFFKTFQPGEYWIYGLKGEYSDTEGKVEYLKGPAFAAKRTFLYSDFNFQLFDIYHDKLGKGEDAILSYTLSKQGEMIYLPIESINHLSEETSHYAKSELSFYRRFSFSRFYHTMEYCRLNNVSYLKSILVILLSHFILMTTLFKSIFYTLINFSNRHFQRSIGILQGWLMGFYYYIFMRNRLESERYWKQKAEIILKNRNSIYRP